MWRPLWISQSSMKSSSDLGRENSGRTHGSWGDFGDVLCKTRSWISMPVVGSFQIRMFFASIKPFQNRSLRGKIPLTQPALWMLRYCSRIQAVGLANVILCPVWLHQSRVCSLLGWNPCWKLLWMPGNALLSLLLPAKIQGKTHCAPTWPWPWICHGFTPSSEHSRDFFLHNPFGNTSALILVGKFSLQTFQVQKAPCKMKAT